MIIGRTKMTLNDRVEELKKVKSELKRLYRKKYAIEKQIIKELDNFDLKDDKNQKVTLDNVVELAIIYEEYIDPLLVRDLYPSVYNYGQKLSFNWGQAILSFEKPKDFWILMNDCRKTEKKVKVKVKRENTTRGTRKRNR